VSSAAKTATCGTKAWRIRFSGSFGAPVDCSVKFVPELVSNVEAENGRIGDPLPTGDIGLDVGGVWVDEKTEADDGVNLRNGRLASLCESDWKSTTESLFAGRMTDAAKGGVELTGESSSEGGMKRARGWLPMNL
jgi:hypothetical protein